MECIALRPFSGKASSRGLEDSPRRSRDGPRISFDALERPQDVPRMPLRHSKTSPRCAQDAAKTAQEDTGTPQDVPRKAPGCFELLQGASRRDQTRPGAALGRFCDDFGKNLRRFWKDLLEMFRRKFGRFLEDAWKNLGRFFSNLNSPRPIQERQR